MNLGTKQNKVHKTEQFRADKNNDDKYSIK